MMKFTTKAMTAALLLSFAAAASATETMAPVTTPETTTPDTIDAPVTTTGVGTSTTATMNDPVGSTNIETTTAITTAAPNFDGLDTNKDGWVAQSELPVGDALASSFSQYDADGDTRLSRSEFDTFATASNDEVEMDDEEVSE